MEEQNTLKKDNIQKVLQFYPFEFGEITLISNRSGRTTWEVETNNGPKILKQANMKPGRMLFIAGAHLHLQQNGLEITPIHMTKNGAICIGTKENQSFVLYDKVEGNEMTYYNLEQMGKIMEFTGKFHTASQGYLPSEISKKRGRVGKWHKLYRWKLQELEGNKQIALSNPNDAFSMMFLEHVDKMLERGKNALLALDEPEYQEWTNQTIELSSFTQQDFTLARFIEINNLPYMKELHSITNDLPSRDLRIILNKMMKKLSVWDEKVAVYLLGSYDKVHPLTEKQYKVLWNDLAFPHMFCSIIHKYYLGQKLSWSDEKYIWALQNIIAVENSMDQFLQDFPTFYREIKNMNGGETNE
ncbi:CotS family spore coat protein [Ferdinandcohnia sp. SAFN-114]|uniref:CotS family spore coat protein n=1 Tax=Ferdinandcohnia sp. SAFN-114 TaxID=3387275 RepID=UPI003F7F498D